MSKIKIYTYEHRLHEYENNITATLPKLQTILDEFNKFGLNYKFKNIADFYDMIRYTPSSLFVKDIIAKGIPEKTILGFRVKPKFLVDQLELPSMEVFEAVTSEVREARFFASKQDCFAIDGSKVVINEKEYNNNVLSFSIVPETPKQLKVYETHKRAAEALTEFHKATNNLMGPCLLEDQQVSNYFTFNKNDNSFNVAEHFYYQNLNTFIQ